MPRGWATFARVHAGTWLRVRSGESMKPSPVAKLMFCVQKSKGWQEVGNTLLVFLSPWKHKNCGCWYTKCLQDEWHCQTSKRNIRAQNICFGKKEIRLIEEVSAFLLFELMKWKRNAETEIIISEHFIWLFLKVMHVTSVYMAGYFAVIQTELWLGINHQSPRFFLNFL